MVGSTLGWELGARPLVLAREFLSLIRFEPLIMKPMLIPEQDKFYSMGKEWRSRNLIFKSTSQPSSGGDTKYMTVKVIGRELERVGEIFMIYLKHGYSFDTELMQLSF